MSNEPSHTLSEVDEAEWKTNKVDVDAALARLKTTKKYKEENLTIVKDVAYIVIEPTIHHPDAKRYNLHHEHWEVAKLDRNAITHAKWKGKSISFDITDTKPYTITAIKLTWKPKFQDWKHDTSRKAEKIDDRYFVSQYRKLWHDDDADENAGELKRYASLAYLAKSWNKSVKDIKRQRTRILNKFKKFYPKKKNLDNILPEVADYTDAEKSAKASQANEAINNAASAEALFAEFDLDMSLLD